MAVFFSLTQVLLLSSILIFTSIGFSNPSFRFFTLAGGFAMGIFGFSLTVDLWVKIAMFLFGALIIYFGTFAFVEEAFNEK